MGFGSVSNAHSLAADAQSLGGLKFEAGKNNPEAIRETAKQFESLFMRELMKSMREATLKSGLLESPGGDLGTDLLDQQFAVQMSGQPGGLSDLIAQQLTRQMGTTTPPDATRPMPDADSDTASVKASSPLSTSTPTSLPARASAATAASAAVAGSAPTRFAARTARPPTENQANFVRQHSRVANEIERATGIPAGFMLGQAGHETGWGKFEIKQKGGAPSHNLFGIKAGASWTGKVAEVTTTEFVDGVAQKRVARFRAYDSYADAFKDYARLISDSPRYAQAKTQTSSAHAFASGLQKAGYATDPDYAAKLSRAINTTLAIRRVQT
ncbi:MAG: flagellar assembly peptidoglycan hydrolase FlgJ [Rhodoferax sp.]|nr:flagellar assembly peptidoglycan hydrolase FlgJ [Rhodoferax sp.]MCF8208401.1 flagellar assembly peptidoglycan hydrolase FlgJ [Rhodoferax sp.]